MASRQSELGNKSKYRDPVQHVYKCSHKNFEPQNIIQKAWANVMLSQVTKIIEQFNHHYANSRWKNEKIKIF